MPNNDPKELNPSPAIYVAEKPELHPNPHIADEGNVKGNYEAEDMHDNLPKKQLEKVELYDYVRVFTTLNIKALKQELCNVLRCGDVVLKKDSTGFHAYLVSFKKDGVGMCLTYTDASVVETQSYDYTDGQWVYNSEDKSELGGE